MVMYYDYNTKVKAQKHVMPKSEGYGGTTISSHGFVLALLVPPPGIPGIDYRNFPPSAKPGSIYYLTLIVASDDTKQCSVHTVCGQIVVRMAVKKACLAPPHHPPSLASLLDGAYNYYLLQNVRQIDTNVSKLKLTVVAIITTAAKLYGCVAVWLSKYKIIFNEINFLFNYFTRAQAFMHVRNEIGVCDNASNYNCTFQVLANRESERWSRVEIPLQFLVLLAELVKAKGGFGGAARVFCFTAVRLPTHV